jgi:tetratricopeptide (TPR) repeat protein
MFWLVGATAVTQLGGSKSMCMTETARIRVLWMFVILGVLICSIPPASAGPADDCNQVRDINRQLRGCTAYIGKGSGSAENLATAHLNRANIYAQRGKRALALKDYAAAMALDPRNPLAPYNRGNLNFDAQRYDLAVADYTHAIELDERFALALLNRGLANERLGDTIAAAKDYAKALTIDPTNKTAQERLKRMNAH